MISPFKSRIGYHKRKALKTYRSLLRGNHKGANIRVLSVNPERILVTGQLGIRQYPYSNRKEAVRSYQQEVVRYWDSIFSFTD